VLSKDGEKLYYLTSFDKGADLWVTEMRTKETKQFAKLGADSASMEMAPDGKFIFVLADGKAMKVATEDAKTEPLKVSGEMLLQGARERSYIFDHVWRQFKQKFLFVDLQGVDWDYYRADLREVPALHQQQLRLLGDAERDARRGERVAYRRLLRRRAAGRGQDGRPRPALRLRLRGRRHEGG
jgi:hypothetical protein